MSDLAKFLLARITEDENGQLIDFGWGTCDIPEDRHWTRDRVLAECEAKRRIVELAAWEGDKRSIRDHIFGPSADLAFQKGIGAALRVLALPHSDHPDYREEWRP